MVISKRNWCILLIILVVIGGSAYLLGRYVKEEPLSQIFLDNDAEHVPLSEETVNFLNENINKLSPEKPVLGGAWQITRISLIDVNHLYVEYEDGHLTRRLLLVKNRDNWEVIGFFEPGKDMWRLESGRNPYLGYPVTIYEKDEQGNWFIIN